MGVLQRVELYYPSGNDEGYDRRRLTPRAMFISSLLSRGHYTEDNRLDIQYATILREREGSEGSRLRIVRFFKNRRRSRSK